MAQFQLTGPDGSTYEVTAPDEQSALNAFSSFHSGQAAAPKPDKYRQAAIDEQAALKAKGIDTGAGFTRRLAHGATLGADNTILAAAETPLEMIKRGTLSPSEGYNYAKAREDQIMNDARQKTGLLGDAAEMLGGAVTGTGAADAGLTATRLLGPQSGVLARSLASGADAAGLGAVSGFNEGNGLGDRLTKAAEGGATGLGLGVATPIAGAVAHGVAAPIISNLRARFNPEGYAAGQFARAVHESGQTPDQIAAAVQQAAREGQGDFAVADALGNPGQRMLATAARGPGQARTDIVNTLNARQADQGRRVVNAINEGFDTPRTAAQTEQAMTEARDNRANYEYGNVREDAQPVDVTNVLNHIDQRVAPFGVPHDRINPDGVTGRMLAYRRMLGGNATNLDGSAAGGLNDFNAAQQVRIELSNEIQKAERAGENPKAAALRGIRNELDTSLENASQGFRRANRNFAQASQNIEQIGEGRAAAMRGRPEDNIADYQALTPEGQYAYRAGMADQLAGKAENSAEGVNKARGLTSDAFQQKSVVMAPNNARMQRQIDRENTMFQTRNAATGNSKTAENLADDAAMEVDPHLIGHIVTGNVHGAVRHLLASGANALTGNTPAVRQAVANILLQRGANVTGPALRQLVDRTIQRMQFMQRVAQIGRAAGRGAVVALPEQMNAPTTPQGRLYVSPAR